MTPCDVTRILLRCSYSSAAVAAVEAAERRRAEVVARDMARKEAVLGLDAVARSQATGPGFHGGGTTYYHEARPEARCRPDVVLLSRIVYTSARPGVVWTVCSCCTCTHSPGR